MSSSLEVWTMVQSKEHELNVSPRSLERSRHLQAATLQSGPRSGLRRSDLERRWHGIIHRVWARRAPEDRLEQAEVQGHGSLQPVTVKTS
jgi:hypothetical protein